MLERIAIYFIEVYQKYLRAVLPCSCRFLPTCSEYAKQAILKYGFGKGVLLASARLLRCHPFSGEAGNDPLL